MANSETTNGRGQEMRWWRDGWVTRMAEADGWLLVRRPRCAPFAMWGKEWAELPAKPPENVPPVEAANER